MNGTPNAVVGRNLKGKIDDMRVWHLARPVNRLGTEVQPNWNDRLIVAHWGNSDVFGRDTASWAEHVRTLRSMTEGVGGMRIRLGIAGGAWSAMLPGCRRPPEVCGRHQGPVEKISAGRRGPGL